VLTLLHFGAHNIMKNLTVRVQHKKDQ